MITLREYQTGAIERLDERIAAGVKRIIIVAPTGSGKTTIAAWIIMRAFGRGQRVLFCAHRRELISQSYNRLMQIGIPKEMLSIMMSTDKRGRPGAPVTVASVDTLRNRDNPPADIVFVDECHRALAPTYRNISRHYSQAIHLGLTATPYRADGKGLKDAYDELLVVSSPQELIDHGYLVCPRVFAAKAPELAGIKIKQGDYDASALADAVDTKILIGNIVEHWQRLASGLRTVAFATSVQHSRNIAAQFVEHGIKAEHLDGTTPTDERDAILGRLDSGETLVVSNCGVLGEGWDQPSCKCAILARPTKSTGLYLQQAGRILRPWQGQVAIILDMQATPSSMDCRKNHASSVWTLAI
jgi:DNA repair protein RadD